MTTKYDIILFGATGFTGNLVAKYLSDHPNGEGFRWAIAGRDKDKLLNIQQSLPDSKPDIIIADVEDELSLIKMTSQGIILMNTVGPFNWFGKKVVEACIKTGTHYLDITGEPSFVAEIYNTMFEKAFENKTCVVNCCGFDSIPADYTAWLTAKKLPLHEAKALRGYVRTNATFSGGTLTTAIQALYMEVEKKSVKTKIKKHPDAPVIPLKIHFNKAIHAWALPMPVVDPHIVKRSAFRMPLDYGNAVSYGQFFVRSTFIKLLKTVIPVVFAMFMVRFKFFRDLMFNKFKSGTGPDEQRRADSKFEVICIGQSKSAKAKTVMAGGDPGYNETSKMFSQSAFCLLDKIKNNDIKFGVLTPVEAFGMELLKRLEKEGILIT